MIAFEKVAKSGACFVLVVLVVSKFRASLGKSVDVAVVCGRPVVMNLLKFCELCLVVYCLALSL